MIDKHDEYYEYHELLWVMHFLELLSLEQCQEIRDECLKRLDEL